MKKKSIGTQLLERFETAVVRYTERGAGDPQFVLEIETEYIKARKLLTGYLRMLEET